MSLSKTGYIISYESVNRVLPTWLIWFAPGILFVLQVYKSNEYIVMTWICSIAIANKYIALKQDGMGFVLCPKQGNKIEGVILNRVCIKKFLFLQGQRLKPSAARLPKYCSSSPPPPPLRL